MGVHLARAVLDSDKGCMVASAPLIWVLGRPMCGSAHGLCRVTPTAGIRPGPEIQSYVGLGP